MKVIFVIFPLIQHYGSGSTSLVSFTTVTEVLVNQSTYLNCSTSVLPDDIHWYHYDVGAEAHEMRSVFAYGQIYEYYKKDFRIDINISNGTWSYNLLILSAKSKYAGTYLCQLIGGEDDTISMQLIVLETPALCLSNMKPDGIIGPNSCGLEIEELRLSCSIAYTGNIPPRLEWKAAGWNGPVQGNLTEETANNIYKYNMTIKSDLNMDGSSFVCQTTRATGTQYNCTSDVVKILYAVNRSYITDKLVNDEVNCSANTSSRSCRYKWMWFNGTNVQTESNNRTLKIQKTGQHQCEATCEIGNKECVITASLVNAIQTLDYTTTGSRTTASEDNPSAKIPIVLGCLAAVFVCVIVVVIVLFLHHRQYWQRQFYESSKTTRTQVEEFGIELRSLQDILCGLFKNPEAETRQVEDATPLNEVLMQEEETNPVADNSTEESHPLLHISGTTADNPIIIPASPEGEQPGKRGKKEKPRNEEITDYDFNPTFLHAESLNSVEEKRTSISGLTVLDKELFITFEKTSEVKVFQAIAFSHMRSFSVMHLDNPLDMVSCPVNNCLYISSPNKIYKVDATGKVIPNWPIEDGGGTLSVTHNQTVILSDWKTTALREYSTDGELICEVRLPSDVHPFHAVKTSVDQFVVNYEQRMENKVHKVSKFDTNGSIIQSFSGMLKFPKYLTVNSDGYIFVADRNNSRVLMINPTLKSSKVILSDKDKLGRPLRICLDEENSRMFVADNKADNIRFMVFKLQKRETGGIEGKSDVISDISGNEEEEDAFLDAKDNLEESQGANEDIAVNQDEPLESNHNFKEDSGGLKDKDICSGIEDGGPELLRAKETQEESRGDAFRPGKRKR